MDAPYYDFFNSLGYLTGKTHRLLAARLNRALAGAGLDITAEQWGVLGQLWNEDGLTQEAICRAMQLEKSSLSRLLDGMEAKGLIARRKDERDARCKRVFLAEGAEPLREKCLALVQENMKMAQRGIPQGTLDLCRGVLQAMQKNLLSGSDLA